MRYAANLTLFPSLHFGLGTLKVYTSFALVGGCLLWSYWPSLNDLVALRWRSPADFPLVPAILLAAILAFCRRDSVPRGLRASPLEALGLLLFAALLRLPAAAWHYVWLDAWSLLIAMAGAITLVAGRQWARWSAPIMVLLAIALPAPWIIEQSLSIPLQVITARGAAWMLVCLNLPAVSAGVNIYIGERAYEVAQACSGLQLTQAVMCVAVAIIFLAPRPWWRQVFFLCLAIPGAIFANAFRVNAFVILDHLTGASPGVTHETSGAVAVVIAALYLVLAAWWLDRAFEIPWSPDRPLSTSLVIHDSRAAQALFGGHTSSVGLPD